MSEQKQVAITDFLTPAEIDRAVVLFRETAGQANFATRCDEEIVRPVIARINEKLGQENNPRYLAYMIEYVLIEAGRAS